MAKYKLQKVNNDYGDLRDSKGNKVRFFQGAVNRIACGQNEYGALTGLKDKSEEAYFEKALGLEEGKLKRTSEFWADWNVKVGAGAKVFDDSEPKDALAIKVLRQRTNIGSSLADSKRGGIMYILTSEDYDAKVAIDDRTYKVKAFAHLAKMTPEDMENFMVSTGRKVDGLSPERIQKLVGDVAELSPKEFLEVVDDADQDLRVFINQLVNTGLYTKNGTGYVDKATGVTITFGVENMIAYFKDVENQPYYVEMQKALAKKRKAKAATA